MDDLSFGVTNALSVEVELLDANGDKIGQTYRLNGPIGSGLVTVPIPDAPIPDVVFVKITVNDGIGVSGPTILAPLNIHICAEAGPTTSGPPGPTTTMGPTGRPTPTTPVGTTAQPTTVGPTGRPTPTTGPPTTGPPTTGPPTTGPPTTGPPTTGPPTTGPPTTGPPTTGPPTTGPPTTGPPTTALPTTGPPTTTVLCPSGDQPSTFTDLIDLFDASVDGGDVTDEILANTAQSLPLLNNVLLLSLKGGFSAILMDKIEVKVANAERIVVEFLDGNNEPIVEQATNENPSTNGMSTIEIPNLPVSGISAIRITVEGFGDGSMPGIFAPMYIPVCLEAGTTISFPTPFMSTEVAPVTVITTAGATTLSPTMTTLPLTTHSLPSTTISVTISMTTLGPTTQPPATTAPTVCLVEAENFPDAAPDGYVGYVEKDQLPGDTDEDESVYVSDELDIGMVLYVECNRCNCTMEGQLQCSEQTCEEDCVWDSWSEWTECNKECDVGSRSRNRSIVQPARYGGSCEVTDGTEIQDCNTEPCPGACEWSSWTGWTDCTHSCGGGNRQRGRTCETLVDGPCSCGGSPAQTEPCNTLRCENETCAEGKEYMDPCDVENPEVDLCRTCADLQSDSCAAPESCDPVCLCAEGLVENEAGECVSPSECVCLDAEGNEFAPGVTNMPDCQLYECVEGQLTITTDIEQCDRDCGYTEWGTWGTCTAECDGGLETRYRDDESPSSLGSGRPCDQPITESRPCNEDACPRCEHEGQMFNIGEVVVDSQCQVCTCNMEGEAECIEKEHAPPREDFSLLISIDDSQTTYIDGVEASSSSGMSPVEVTVPGSSQVIAIRAFNGVGPNGGVLVLDSDYFLTGSPEFDMKCRLEDTSIPLSEWTAIIYDDSGWTGVIKIRTDVTSPSDRAEPIWLEGAGANQAIYCRAYIKPVETLSCSACDEGFVRSPSEDDCCRCIPEPPQPTPCTTSTITEVIQVYDGDVLCVSPGPIPISFCSGTCVSSDSSPIRIKSTQEELQHGHICKCCSGTGRWEDVTVNCQGAQSYPLEVQVQHFDNCACNQCGTKSPLPSTILDNVCEGIIDFGARAKVQAFVSAPGQVAVAALEGSEGQVTSAGAMLYNVKFPGGNVRLEQCSFRITGADSVTITTGSSVTRTVPPNGIISVVLNGEEHDSLSIFATSGATVTLDSVDVRYTSLDERCQQTRKR